MRRGRHKIFIGMAPGVGKTYKMLEEGHSLRKQGTDVVIGLLETHGRKETAAKAEGLEIVPRKILEKEGFTLSEMDTEAIIARSPQLCLIDELAHTNAPGSEREKRFQDVEIILSRGIDVYSTRIPDRILEEADEVIVVDVTAETLEERLLAGKIYAPEKIQPSLNNFFRRRNLIALRELALREVADTVEEEASNSTFIGQFCPVHERVLVCVSTYPNSLRLLRRGARIAGYMNAEFFVIFVDKPDRFLTKEEALHIETCERLCRDFEGKFLRVKSYQVASAIAEVAEQERITQIVIGESLQSRWKNFIKGSFTQKLMRLIWQKNIDLHIIATEPKVPIKNARAKGVKR
ncbi:MAG: universal stress protein [Microcystis sp. 53602_E8]|nr:universal stress protein [Microcystis sp. 53602_E8]